MPRCFLSSVRPPRGGFIHETGVFSYETDFKPSYVRGPKFNIKRQKIILKHNETIFNDKVPISTRFYLQLLKRSQFLPQFIDTEIYEYAQESERGFKSPEPRRKRLIDKTYNLRSNEGRRERKSYEEFRTQRKVKGLEDLDRKVKIKEPLAPLLEELKTREPLKPTSKGSEIDKIAEKLKSLVTTNTVVRLNEELHTCSEAFDLENVEPGCDERDARPHPRATHHCTLCGKGFDRPWVLKGHMRLHTGERPFPCPTPLCGRTFADRSNLRAHQRTRGHHSWQWRCVDCGKAFSQRRYLQRHTSPACKKYRMVSRNSKIENPTAKDVLPVPLYGVICHNPSKSILDRKPPELDHKISSPEISTRNFEDSRSIEDQESIIKLIRKDGSITLDDSAKDDIDMSERKIKHVTIISARNKMSIAMEQNGCVVDQSGPIDLTVCKKIVIV